jgi:hypothetical protein
MMSKQKGAVRWVVVCSRSGFACEIQVLAPLRCDLENMLAVLERCPRLKKFCASLIALPVWYGVGYLPANHLALALSA